MSAYNKIKTSEEIKNIRISGKMLNAVLIEIEKKLQAGMSGIDIDNLAVAELKALGGTPAFLGYMGFPNSICISVNDAVVHGIPNAIVFKTGDIIGFDYGVTYNGMITDAARTFIVGNPDNEKTKQLVATAKKSLDAGIAKIIDGCRVGDISAAVEKVLEDGGYGNVRDLVGHGVGHHVHEEPEIPNYGKPGSGPILKSGMTICIEPMVTLGDWRVVLDPDGWTVRTRDGSISAHFEDTLLVTKKGAEILTR